MQPDLSRRAALAGAAALPLAATTPVAALSNPDAELLAAWDGFVRANREFKRAYAALPNGGTDAEHEPYYRVIDFHRERVEGLPARTAAGVAVKLRLLFSMQMGCIASFNTAVYGEPVSDKLAASLGEELHGSMLWRLIQDVERMAANA